MNVVDDGKGGDNLRVLMRYVAGTVAVCGLVVGIVTLAMWQERERYRERATVATSNIAALLDHHVSNVFDKVDVLLRSEARYFQEVSKSGRIRSGELNRHLAQQEDLVDEVDGLRILDARGIVRFGKNVPVSAPVNLSDREFFIQARDHPEAGMIVSGPVFARIAQKWVIVMARRLSNADGTFAGVIYANMATTYFEKILSSPTLGPHGAATLRKADFALVHRFPDSKNAVGNRQVSTELAQIIRDSPQRGDYIARTALDGIERSNSYRKLQKYPFYVIVGLATDDYMGGWKQSIALISGLAGLAIAVIVLSAFLNFRYQRSLSEDIAERIRIGNELERAIAERTRLNTELEKRAQDAEAASRAKTVFLRTMSHELRTPMNGVLGMAGLALRLATDPRQQEYLDKLKCAAEQLLSIINNLLNYAQMESESFVLSPQRFTLGSVVQTVAQKAAPGARAKGLEFSVHIAAELENRVLMGDAGRIGNVLEHLIGNAIKFTPAGQVTVRVLPERDTAADLCVRFEVSDTGIGISAEDDNRVFNAFEQVDGSMTRSHGGIGLGLALCKRVVAAMDGIMGYDSVPGTGSTFWFIVKLGKSA